MSDTASGLLLKILSGVQFGVEVALDEGTYSFGNGPDADIQFVDVTLQPVHGRVRIRGGKLSLRSDGGEIATSSGLTIARGGADWHEIAQLDVITAGTTRFAIGGQGAKWDSVAVAPGGVASGAPAGGASASGKRGGGLAVGVLGLAAVLLLAGGAVYLAGGRGQILGVAQAPEREPVAIVREAMAGLPFDHALEVTEAVDGTIDVAGYVQNVVERRAAMNALSDAGIQVRRRIWVRDAIENEVGALIRSQDVAMAFDLSPHGVLRLHGTVLDPAVAERVVGLLRAEVFGIAEIRDEVRTAEDYLREVTDLLDSARLRDRVILRLDGLLIEATGVVTNDLIDNWVGFIQVYSRRYAEVLPLRSFVTLEAAGGAVGAPIVIGTADPAVGRSVPAELLSSEAVPQTQDIFALPVDDVPAGAAPAAPNPVAAPEADGAAAAPAPTGGTPPAPDAVGADPALRTAVLRLFDEAPELAQQMVAVIEQGQTPSAGLLQQALGVVDGRMTLRAGPSGLEPVVILPGSTTAFTPRQIEAALAEYRANPEAFAAASASSGPGGAEDESLPEPGAARASGTPVLADGDTPATVATMDALPNLVASLLSSADFIMPSTASRAGTAPETAAPVIAEQPEPSGGAGGGPDSPDEPVLAAGEQAVGSDLAPAGAGDGMTSPEVAETGIQALLPAAAGDSMPSGSLGASIAAEVLAASDGAVFPAAADVPGAPAVDFAAGGGAPDGRLAPGATTGIAQGARGPDAPPGLAGVSVPPVAGSLPLVRSSMIPDAGLAGGEAPGVTVPAMADQPDPAEAMLPVAGSGGTGRDRTPDTAPQPMADPPPPALAGDMPVGSVAGYDSFAGVRGLNPAARRLIGAAETLMSIEQAAVSSGRLMMVGDLRESGQSLVDLVRAQHEGLSRGETLLQMPRPIGARPILRERPATCWPGSRIQIEALPTVLLWLDMLSLHADLDLAEMDPSVRPTLMEVALSPDRLVECLELIGGSFANRLLVTSAFLAESRRNPDFSQFLFRNVPVFDIEVVGLNLIEERYVQTSDGRKLREGVAPTLSSRLAVIGDRGILFRVESGYEVRLYNDAIAWRVAEN